MTEQTPVEAFNAWAAERNWPAHCDPSLQFEASELADLLQIWRGLASPGAIPERRKLTARLLKHHLSRIAILERACEQPVRYKARLLGTQLALHIGEMQGKYLDEVIDAEVMPHWSARIELTLKEQRPLRFVSRVDLRHLYHLRSETLWLPLAIDGDTKRLVLMSAVLSFNAVMPAEQASALTRLA